MERFSIFPISIGCISQSSVDVIDNSPKKSHKESNLNSSPPNGGEVEEKLKSNSIGISKPNISEKLQKIVKGFKSLPQRLQLYSNREEEDEDEMEMVIGFPTDVQHVGHIGWDGSKDVISAIKNWDRAPTDFMSFPSLSAPLKQ